MSFQKLFKPVTFVLCVLPLLLIVLKGFNNNLGVNPAETILDTMGSWAIYILLITLSVTPIRKLTGWGGVIRLRRMLGLFVFFYVCLHFLSYIWFDQYFDWNEILKDIIKRPFITLGFATFVLLIPLAVTSNNRMMLRLKKRWKLLHQLIYPIAIMATLHFFWMTRADYTQPVMIAMILSALLAYRLVLYYQKKPQPVRKQSGHRSSTDR
ncbi:MAG: sulfoxide reductase heme-binding subunit YedZ [Gammaproteobacteria bacterium]|nr:sulfoxide reductase heme-binding subunit YedZ [Gammaproteobacteria bacterium]